MDYEETTKTLFLSSEEGLFPTVEDGAKLAENIIDSLRIWIDNNNYSVEIVFYVCEGSADKKDKKRTKDVAPHYHILMLGNPADKIVEVIEKYIESKINRDCHLDAEEVYDLDTLLRYIIPQCKKIRSMALDKKGLAYFGAAKAHRSSHWLIEDDIRLFCAEVIVPEIFNESYIEKTSLWEEMLRKVKDKSCYSDLSWLDT